MKCFNPLETDLDGNWWTRKTPRYKALYAVGLLGVITAIVLISVFASPKKKAPVDVCTTDSCKETAKIISENLDSSADPCDDFYLYACGKFNENHPLGSYRAIYALESIISAARNRVYEVTKELTQKSFDNKGDSKAMKYVKTMLDLCIDTEKMEKIGLAPLKELVKDLGHWKQTSTLESTESIAAKPYLDKMAKIMGETGISLIEGLVLPQRYVLPRLDEPDRYTFLIVPQERNQVNRDVLKNIIIEAADLMQAPRIKQNVNKIIAFAADLWEIGTDPEQLLSLTDPFKVAQLEISPNTRITVGGLKRQAPGIDWLNFLNRVFKAAGVKKQFMSTDTIVVFEIEKIKALTKILDKHDNDIIEDYLGLLLLNDFSFFTTAKSRNIMSNFTNTIHTTLKTTSSHEENCVGLIADRSNILGLDFLTAYKTNLNYLIARLYSDKYFDDDDKKDIQELVINLRDAFKSFLPSHDWLDDETRNAATEKVDKIRINTGFPNFVKNNTKLDQFYPFPSLDNPDAVMQYKGLLSGLITGNFERLNQESDLDKDWPMGPVMASFNAAYMPLQNSITFPATSLQGMVFNNERPSSLNYGSLGLVAGHEITHGFDTNGANYAADGRYKNWWSEYSRNNFNKKTKCFEEQYSAITDKQSGLQLDGKKTVGENIADNGGIHQAFAAYKKVAETKKEALLPGLTKFNHDQLFFLSHANVWCMNADNAFIKDKIEDDVHSLGRYRVTVPLMNSPDFAKAFNCPKGSKMNPEKKCSLW